MSRKFTFTISSCAAGVYFISIFIVAGTSLLAIVNQPALEDESGRRFVINDPGAISSIAGVQVSANFFLAFPERLSLIEEQHWWRQHTAVYDALKNGGPVSITIDDVETTLNVIFPGGELLEREVLIVYIVAILYMILGVSLYLRHDNHYNIYVVLYLFSGSIFVSSVCALSGRVLTLPTTELRVLVFFLYGSLISHIVSLQLAMNFPNRKQLLQGRFKYAFHIAHAVAVVMWLAYLLELIPFSTMPTSGVIMVFGALVAFVHSWAFERDRFIRQQVLYLVSALLSAGMFYGYFFAPNSSLEPELSGFANYALVLLAYYFVLISATENVTFYRKQLAIERRADREKEQFRQEFHDSTLNRLASISLLSDLTLKSVGSNAEDAREKILSIKQQATGHSRYARGLLWVSDEDCATWDDFFTRLRRCGYDRVAAHNCQFQLDIEYERGASEPPELLLRVCLYQIFVEAISNSLEHANPDHVRVTAVLEVDRVRMCIDDDGCGFSESDDAPGHYGLVYMRRRVAELNGSFQIRSQLSQGTHICVALPLRSE
jgi:signal transduction histidine kinase